MAERGKNPERPSPEEEGEGTMTVQEAGQKGGETVLNKYGREFYSELGQKTQAEAQKYEQLKKEGKVKE